MKDRLLVLSTMFTALFLLFSVIPATADDKQPLLLILTSGDTQTQGMALVLTSEAQRQGAEVRVLLCSEAGKLALKGHEAPTLKPRDISPKQMLESLMQQGARVEVCALFLPNLGKAQEDLVQGVSAAKPPVITELLLNKKVRLLTF